MLDVLGSISLTLGGVLVTGVLILSAFRDASSRLIAASVAALWFGAAIALGALGVFSGGPAAIGIAVALPLIAGVVLLSRRRDGVSPAFAVPLPTLVGVHVSRLLGVFFLVLLAAHRLPPTFASSAGWGDLFIGATALPMAAAISRRAGGWRWMTAIWTVLGTFDLLSALALGVGSNANSPLRFIFETPSSDAIGTLPWVMIPTLFIPMLPLTHVATFVQLTSGAPQHSPRGTLHEVPAR
jgi:hypothetical protein